MTPPRPESDLSGKVVIVTGAARRVGAVIASILHNAGANILLHFRHSQHEAEQLKSALEQSRKDSVKLVQGDFDQFESYDKLAQQAYQAWGRIDALVNNASTFFPTPLGSITETQWETLINPNLKTPLFLSQALAGALKEHNGCIVNIVDIHAERPLKNHPVYCAAKAGLAMLTKSLACELGPEIRVNGVAPGAILWPESESGDNALDDKTKQQIMARTFLKRQGSPEDIAGAVLYFIKDAPYVTGQILAVDGGRSQNS